MDVLKEMTLASDVLIIGGGASGLWTAARIKQLRPDADVLIVDNGPVGWGGLMSMAEGDVDAVTASDSMDGWLTDLTRFWDGLCDQTVMRALLEHSEERILDYESFGSPFRRDEAGNLWGAPQRGLPHVKKYPPKDRSRGGFLMATGLANYVESLHPRHMGYICITDLLQSGSRVCGAVGFDFHEGVLYTFRSRAVVLAGGPQGWDGIVNPGGWLDFAMRAGAEARNMEFAKAMWMAVGGGNPNVLLPVGASYELVNCRGEAFMQRYAPGIGCNADGNYVCRGIALEEQAGNGPIRLQVGIPPELADTVSPELIERFHDHKVSAGCSETLGGLATDLYGRTNLEGLFAVGRCRSIEPGVYIGGFALSVSANTGYLTGSYLAEHLDQLPDTASADAGQYESIRARIGEDLARSSDTTPAQARREIIRLHDNKAVWLMKTEKSLRCALDSLAGIRDGSLARMGAGGDLHQLKRVYDVRSTYRLTELFFQASLYRTESRAGHYRADFPEMDSDWRCWQHISVDGNGTYRSRRVPVPPQPLPVAESEYYSRKFAFPRDDRKD